MAGDWIPMRMDLHEDPSVIAIAVTTGLDECGVVGRLHRLWSWANKHLADGNAASVTDIWVDRYLATPGFAAAMIAAGWLVRGESGIEFPRFERWNSQGAKRRALTAQRVKGHRDRSNAGANAHRNASSVTGALPEKRREEKKKEDPPNPPQAGGGEEPPAAVPAELDTEEFRAAWGEWKTERAAKRVKPYTPTGERGQFAKLAPFGPVVAVLAIRESIAQGWQGLFPDRVKRVTQAPPPRASPGQSRMDRIAALAGVKIVDTAAQQEPSACPTSNAPNGSSSGQTTTPRPSAPPTS